MAASCHWRRVFKSTFTPSAPPLPTSKQGCCRNYLCLVNWLLIVDFQMA